MHNVDNLSVICVIKAHNSAQASGQLTGTGYTYTTPDSIIWFNQNFKTALIDDQAAVKRMTTRSMGSMALKLNYITVIILK